MTKMRLLHQPRPVLYDSGIMSRVLDDLFDPRLTDFVAAHAAIVATREVAISQTTVFEMQPVLRVLRRRFPARATQLDSAFGQFAQVALDERIGQAAISLKKGIESLKFADATIAATAIVYGWDLFTLNEADFTSIPGLRLYKPANYYELLARLGAAKGQKPPAALSRAGCGGRGWGG